MLLFLDPLAEMVVGVGNVHWNSSLEQKSMWIFPARRVASPEELGGDSVQIKPDNLVLMSEHKYFSAMIGVGILKD